MALKLIGEVSLDGSGFERGLNKLGSTAAGKLKNLVAGAFGVYSIHQAITKTVESADELVTASKRLDLTVEQLQIMRQAAKESGVEFGKLESALEKINLAREKALKGDAKKLAAFARFGVTEDDLRNRTAGQIFSGPMAAAARTSSAQDMTAAGAAIFGIRQFGQLVPVLKTDFDELGGKMQSLGSLMSTDAAVGVKMLKDEFGLLSNIVAAGLAPALLSFAEILMQVVGKVKSSGTFWGDFITRLQMMDASGEKDWRDSVKSLWLQIKTAYDHAGGETAAADAEWGDFLDALKNKVAEMANRLKNPPPPQIAPGLEAAAKKSARAKTPDSDALLAVGNFLGSGANLINSIAEQQLDVAREQLAAQKITNTKLDDLADVIEENAGSLEIP